MYYPQVSMFLPTEKGKGDSAYGDLFSYLPMLDTKHRASHMLGKYSVTELHL